MKIEDITLGMTVYCNPATKAEVARCSKPIKFVVRGFCVSLSSGGNQVQKVIVHVTEGEGSGAVKNDMYFGYIALDASRLSLAPKV